MSDVPPGWCRSTLGELGNYWNGRGFKKTEWRDSGRPIIRIQNLTGTSSSFNYFQGEVDDRHVARPGDVLVSWAATLGVYEWRGSEALVNQHIFKVDSFIDKRFHRYLIEHVLDDLNAKTHGSGMVHITRKRFDETPVLVPKSLDEQQQIVEAIGEQFSRLDVGVEALRRAKRSLIGLRASILRAAIEGLPTVPLAHRLREPLRNGKSAKRSIGGRVRVLTLSAVTVRDFSERNTKTVDLDPDDLDDLWIEPGDIFIERSNTPELVGSAALYGGESRWAIFPDLLIRARVNDEIDARFVELCLQSPQLREYFRSRAKGIAGSMPKIDQATVGEALIPSIPPDRQRAIVAKTDRQLSTLQAVQASIESGLARSESLRRAILGQAFGRHLVPSTGDIA